MHITSTACEQMCVVRTHTKHFPQEDRGVWSLKEETSDTCGKQAMRLDRAQTHKYALMQNAAHHLCASMACFILCEFNLDFKISGEDFMDKAFPV